MFSDKNALPNKRQDVLFHEWYYTQVSAVLQEFFVNFCPLFARS